MSRETRLWDFLFSFGFSFHACSAVGVFLQLQRRYYINVLACCDIVYGAEKFACHQAGSRD